MICYLPQVQSFIATRQKLRIGGKLHGTSNFPAVVNLFTGQALVEIVHTGVTEVDVAVNDAIAPYKQTNSVWVG